MLAKYRLWAAFILCTGQGVGWYGIRELCDRSAKRDSNLINGWRERECLQRNSRILSVLMSNVINVCMLHIYSKLPPTPLHPTLLDIGLLEDEELHPLATWLCLVCSESPYHGQKACRPGKQHINFRGHDNVLIIPMVSDTYSRQMIQGCSFNRWTCILTSMDLSRFQDTALGTRAITNAAGPEEAAAVLEDRWSMLPHNWSLSAGHQQAALTQDGGYPMSGTAREGHMDQQALQQLAAYHAVQFAAKLAGQKDEKRIVKKGLWVGERI